ncbi:hypothetical protein GSE84_12635 [Escherichia coli]|nr:hypothetical protein [Escherichia coli]EFH8440929.1 hypothetical protein [Escherichia coli]EFI3545954.1 hypothetical protein [Escherichia coli]EFI3713614.1 hypothetical protein [Escherichia coli]
MLPSETMIWQPEFTDKTLSRKHGAVQIAQSGLSSLKVIYYSAQLFSLHSQKNKPPRESFHC